MKFVLFLIFLSFFYSKATTQNSISPQGGGQYYDLTPNNPDSTINNIQQLLEKKQTTLKLDETAQLYLYLGRSYKKIGMFHAASAALEKTMDSLSVLNTSLQAEIHEEYGNVLKVMEREEGGITTFKTSLINRARRKSS